ncbi:pantothenate transporter liz1 [Colletotrichum paranaense]|uniref:Pantothenate transporter liz1 n=1 Tax=Colletotrichum paranaense TaxID=1914294 RepID=A0ABQ9SWZ5_9PEZI|nr:pantothenate transporter liz1 [Colletotrichum paranaense]KAK1543875.1 pantothenate transporter liz1 [Colletotrichum paranaense]
MAESLPQPSNAPSRSFRSFIWDTDTHLKSHEERVLLRKLDWSILTIGCLGFFMKYLDQGNLANAYVSGMQEDLKMFANEYTYAQMVYTCAYAVMQIPSTLIVQKIRPSIWLAAMEVGWVCLAPLERSQARMHADTIVLQGIFTFAQAGTQNVGQLYAFRFLVGFFESSFFPVLLYVLGSWYTKTELAKRVAIFHMTAPLGSAFGGYLQAAVYKSLDGAHGHAGWRWLYIVCGCMTIPVGVATLFVLPDTPYTTKSKFLTAKECELAIDRVTKAGKAAPAGVTLATFKRVLLKWRWYAFVLGYVLYGESCQSGGYFAIWLKAEKFSVVDRNVIPTGSKLISAFCIILWGFLSDYTGSRFALIICPLVRHDPKDQELPCSMIESDILVGAGLDPKRHLGFLAAKRAAEVVCFPDEQCASHDGGFPFFSYTWANEICAGDNEERALVISSMNGMQYAVDAWLPLVIFPQTMAPTFRYGFPATFGFIIAAIIAVVGIRLLVFREQKRGSQDGETTLESGQVEFHPERNESIGEIDKTDKK